MSDLYTEVMIFLLHNKTPKKISIHLILSLLLLFKNMEKDRQIQVLRDGNLELREQITELNKDILEYKELLELKNLGSQVGATFLQIKICQT